MSKLKFVERLEAAMAAVTPEQLATPPFDEIIREGETVIGEALPEHLIRLWWVIKGYCDQANTWRKEHDQEHLAGKAHNCDEFCKKIAAFTGEIDLAKYLFWQEICETFGAQSGSIGVRMSADGKPVLVSIKQKGFNLSGITIIGMGEGPRLRDILAGQP